MTLPGLSVQFSSLTPANEVWGKVHDQHPGGGLHRGEGLHPVDLPLVGGWADPTATSKAGGTHPTGMLSCFQAVFGKLWLNFQETMNPPLNYLILTGLQLLELSLSVLQTFFNFFILQNEIHQM